MKIKLSLLLLFISISSFPQSAESLKTEIKKLYQANYLLDFDGIAFLSYPKIAETLGTDEMQDQLEKHYENDKYRLRFQLETVPFQYGEIKKIDGKSFCVITCRNPIRYFFPGKYSTETAAETTTKLKELLKTKEVTFEPKRNSFNVTKTTTFVAIADTATANQWRFFNLDDITQDAAFRGFFNQSIQKELGL
jgi:hypothetical protein